MENSLLKYTEGGDKTSQYSYLVIILANLRPRQLGLPVAELGQKSVGKNVYTKVFSALKTQVPSTGRKRFGVYQKACFQGKTLKIHIHQRAFKVVGDPFAQHWCIDFGLLRKENRPQMLFNVGNAMTIIQKSFRNPCP